MSRKDIYDLATLDPSDFGARDYAALNWVRQFLTEKEGASPDAERAFREAFSPHERRNIMAAMKGMFFANLSYNTASVLVRRMLGMPEKDQPLACRLPR